MRVYIGNAMQNLYQDCFEGHAGWINKKKVHAVSAVCEATQSLPSRLLAPWHSTGMTLLAMYVC